MQARTIEVTGLVQGVGFRPFVHRIAKRTGVTGWVLNTNKGVTLFVQGSDKQVSVFLDALVAEAPDASRIDTISGRTVAARHYKGFTIRRSRSVSSDVTDVAPDIAVCDDCLSDMKLQPHRLDYPFINCTHCGPRFSIVRSVPYDRANTTMDRFRMCPVCAAEYSNIDDRRFHAQPVACNNCGPVYSLHANGRVTRGFHKILAAAAGRIDSGDIAAIKGIGGYQLVCDAFNESAVTRLRRRKFREGKPFALMARDIETIRLFCTVSAEEEKALRSWRRPIVLLKKKQKIEKRQLAAGISPGLGTLGFVLPYMPFHYQLFGKLETGVVVFTSGNLSEEPIICDDDEALSRLQGIADLILTHDRLIYSRSDDSVVFIADGREQLIRRSRGYVPGFVSLPVKTEGIFAAGAEMMGAFCIGKGDKAVMSQYLGDLKNPEGQAFYSRNVPHFLDLFRSEQKIVAHDLHPDYFTTRYAKEIANKQNLRIVPVQHHHAHIASVMAEHGLTGDVVGVCFDGTGYGTDGNSWGGEFMICSPEEFERVSHLGYIQLPGGDKAIEEPWRIALAYLVRLFGDKALDLPLDLNKNVPLKSRKFVADMILKNVNCPLSSGAGRLFDAVSAIVGICLYSRFEAEAPMKLEAAIERGSVRAYHIPAGDPVDTGEIVRQVVKDTLNGIKPGVVATRFHNTLISLIFERSLEIAKRREIGRIVLSGGVFQNRYLLEGLIKKFSGCGLELYLPVEMPANDGGIALGQLYVAANRIKKNVSRGTRKDR